MGLVLLAYVKHLKCGFKMGNKVLVVEDNEMNMKLMLDLLEVHGIGTISTSEGAEVLEMARAEKPDLILLDINLPGIYGLDVIKDLKADDDVCDIPVIAVTANAMAEDEKKAREAGCSDYVTKPISLTGFIETVKQYVSNEE